jgi:predicted nucleic acid-binding protein
MMEHYLVDTNVIIDMLLDREDADAACAVIDGAERGEYVLHISALSFTNIYYSLRKILTREQRISALIQLREVLEVAVVGKDVIDTALKSEWKDFEDAVQNFAAEANPNITAIITRNKKDFTKSTLKIIDSLDFLNKN